MLWVCRFSVKLIELCELRNIVGCVVVMCGLLEVISMLVVSVLCFWWYSVLRFGDLVFLFILISSFVLKLSWLLCVLSMFVSVVRLIVCWFLLLVLLWLY